MDKDEALTMAANELGLTITDHSIHRQVLDARINDMLQHDFQKLINLLYRIDIDEDKLRALLEQNTDRDAAEIITDLIIDRQLQKIRSREQFRPKDGAVDEEEKW